MRVVTWNVNSVRQRLEHLLDYLKEARPDVVCLQETKAQDHDFPRALIEAAGYRVEAHGQKTFNGVALLSLHPLEEVVRGLPGDEGDAQARYIEALVSGPERPVRVASIYLPNGNPVGTEKYAYKLAFAERLLLRARELLRREEATVLAGDYNVIPDAKDARHPANWEGDALFLPGSRAAYRRLLNLGLADAVRATTEAADAFTFYDYQAGAFQRGDGIRIDHLLLSPRALDRLRGAAIDRHVRGWDKPSDHVPVRIDLAA